MELKAFFLCLIISILITPFVKRLAFKIKALDYPNERKVHSDIMPRLGGVAIFVSFQVGLLIFVQTSNFLWPIIFASTIVLLVGVIDDIKRLPVLVKLGVQVIAALIVVSKGIQIDFITLPFGPKLELGVWAIPITIFWIVGVTNAINLIDGLDGLATGISSIVLITISGMSLVMGNYLVALLAIMLLGSTIGFLFFNFYPAKIFLGDSGAYFLGFMISNLAILGLFKHLTVFSIVIPIIILGVPILDTVFAVVRRVSKGKAFHLPDKRHIHHCLLQLGYSQRKAVLLLYSLSAFFSVSAIFFTRVTMWGSTILLVFLLIIIELLVEITGLISQSYRPILNFIYGKYGKY